MCIRDSLLAHAPEGTCTQWRPALATRGRGAEELPPSGCPWTSLALETRGRGSWTHRRAVGPSCLALATRGRGAEELPPSGCPCTSLALATRGRGSWTVRRAVGPSCLLMTLAGYSDRLQLEARAATTLRPRRSQAGLAGP